MRRPVSRRILAACLIACLTFGAARGQTGWAVSPFVTVPATRYSVQGAHPDCVGRTTVNVEVRRAVEGLGLRTPDRESPPAPLSRAVGNLLQLVGIEAVRQDYAECTEVCAVIPLSATRVTNLLSYVTDAWTQEFRAMPFDRYIYYFHWEPEVDTTRLTESGRLVCAQARNWYQADRTAILIVGYEE